MAGGAKDMLHKVQNDMQSVSSLKRVETFVEVRIISKNLKPMMPHEDPTKYEPFIITSRSTNVAEGDFPEWNELLKFPLKPIYGKFTKEELLDADTQLHIALYDRELYNIIDSGYSTQIVTKIEIRFLGSLQIPFSTVLQNPPKIEAMLKLNRPMPLLNYSILDQNIFLVGDEVQEIRANEQLITQINLSISLDPVLDIPPDSDLEYFPGAENPQLLVSMNNWIKGIKEHAQFNKRCFKIFAENINGQSVLLSRYITDQQPPPDVIDLDHHRNDEDAIEKAARFVSLIPTF